MRFSEFLEQETQEYTKKKNKKKSSLSNVWYWDIGAQNRHKKGYKKKFKGVENSDVRTEKKELNQARHKEFFH